MKTITPKYADNLSPEELKLQKSVEVKNYKNQKEKMKDNENYTTWQDSPYHEQIINLFRKVPDIMNIMRGQKRSTKADLTAALLS